MKNLNLLLLFILLGLTSLTSTQAKENINTFQWREIESLPMVNGMEQQFGLASPFVGTSNGAVIVTDTNMVKAGINKKALSSFGVEVFCFIADEDVTKEAKSRGITRATVSIEKAMKIGKPVIFAIGNAPTALLEICKLHREGTFKPVAVIGVPVGFVNVIEAKNMLIQSQIPCIVARGRKGGSNIAAAICNAITYKTVV